jgi:hypothetical protein
VHTTGKETTLIVLAKCAISTQQQLTLEAIIIIAKLVTVLPGYFTSLLRCLHQIDEGKL